MSKWYGKIGFATPLSEVEPGIYGAPVIEREYFGDLITNRWNRQNSGGVNDNINISNDISIVADPYAMDHCSTMAYVEFMGAKWKITKIDIQYPRLILSVGGVWNGDSPRVTE